MAQFVTGSLKKQSRAILAGLQLPGVSDFEHESSMSELERLVKTLGFETLGRVTQKRKGPTTAAIFGKGKLQELARWTGGSGVVEGFRKPGTESHVNEMSEYDEIEADDDDVFFDQGDGIEGEEGDEHQWGKATIVILDCDLSPTQLSNLQKATGVEVLDRSGVILEIFSRHAKSREARLQVEIAKLNYLAPRLRVAHVGSDRQGGGIGSKGAGETSHELDRRRIRDRIAELRSQLKTIRSEQLTRRAQRQEVALVALIGYTNAGKSSIMRHLTKTEVEGEDKLFATLDTTIRVLQPETTPRILVSDTVGFIKKLPHDLVASFRSTLDEAESASFLLFVVDGSDANFRFQLEVTRTVIAEIGADKNPSHLIINKIDLLTEAELSELKLEFPEALLISSQVPEDIERLRQQVVSFFEQDMTDKEIIVPYMLGHVLSKIRERARVLSESYDEDGTHLTVRASEQIHHWIQKQL